MRFAYHMNLILAQEKRSLKVWKWWPFRRKKKAESQNTEENTAESVTESQKSAVDTDTTTDTDVAGGEPDGDPVSENVTGEAAVEDKAEETSGEGLADGTAEADAETAAETAEAAAEAETTDEDNADSDEDDDTEGVDDGEGTENSGEEFHEPKKSLYDWVSKKPKKRPRTVKVKKVPVVLSDTVTLGEGRTKICTPIAGATDDEVLEQAKAAAAAEPDLVEWRADYYEHITNVSDADALVKKLAETLGSLPILFTYRSSNEGGRGRTDSKTYESVALWAAGRPEIAIIDIEGLASAYDAEVLVRHIHEAGKPVIGSAHFFKSTPKKRELIDIFDRLQRTGADVLKVAAMPEKSRDVLRIMNVTKDVDSEVPCPLITISMGDLGKITRISGSVTGSCMTFGVAAAATAPGQMSVADLKNVMQQVQ